MPETPKRVSRTDEQRWSHTAPDAAVDGAELDATELLATPLIPPRFGP